MADSMMETKILAELRLFMAAKKIDYTIDGATKETRL
jgi:hypothetical protein